MRALAVAFLAALLASPAAAANHPPKFPRNFDFTVSTKYQYDPGGLLFGGRTKIKIETPARDRDGDRLRYRWKAWNILSDGTRVRARMRTRRLRASWERALDFGELAAARVVVTVRDGHGGRDRHTFKFRRGGG